MYANLLERERHKNLKKQDVVLYRCPKCGNYIKEWTEVCECGNQLDWGENDRVINRRYQKSDTIIKNVCRK